MSKAAVSQLVEAMQRQMLEIRRQFDKLALAEDQPQTRSSQTEEPDGIEVGVPKRGVSEKPEPGCK